ncbi:MAG: hypothetical protein KA314_03925 [Chloroflexi bacterium]|nr:hypothetical protein [Chloroflexota bacterium]MBP8054960.1 hypothetical protein [Chloroflexota bacterium]
MPFDRIFVAWERECAAASSLYLISLATKGRGGVGKGGDVRPHCSIISSVQPQRGGGGVGKGGTRPRPH